MYDAKNNLSWRRGFALPTVLITSLVMLIVLLATLTATSSANVALRSQYYLRTAKEAAEAGITMAQLCIEDAGVPTWSDASPLRPNTNCSGGPCSGGASCYLINDTAMRTTFSVGAPELQSDGTYFITVTGMTQLLRTSNGKVWDQYQQTLSEANRFAAEPQIAGGAGWKEGNHNGYMLTATGTLYGWGSNEVGQLGPASLGTIVKTPIQIDLPSGVSYAKSVANSGQGASILCIIGAHSTLGNQVYCRGSGLPGGDGINDGNWHHFPLPSPLTALDVVLQGYGTDSLCVLASNHQVYCAGRNAAGMLGNGIAAGEPGAGDVPFANPTKFRLDLADPGPVSGSASSLTVKKLFHQDIITCVIASDNQAYCAGRNDYGQLGRGNVTRNYGIGNATPGRVLIPGQPAVEDIRTTYHSSTEGIFFLTKAGEVYMSGSNTYGTANDGAFTGTSCPTGGGVNCYQTPRKLTDGSTGALISLGDMLTGIGHGVCAIERSPAAGTTGLQCIGTNSFGQLGSSCTDRASWRSLTIADSQTGAVQSLRSDLNAEAHYQMNSLVVITASGDAYAAGDNTYGKLGTGDALTACMPVFKKIDLPQGVDAVAVANTDEYTTFILGSNGRVYAMGRNNNGQLGDGTTTDSKTPVPVRLPRLSVVY